MTLEPAPEHYCRDGSAMSASAAAFDLNWRRRVIEVNG